MGRGPSSHCQSFRFQNLQESFSVGGGGQRDTGKAAIPQEAIRGAELLTEGVAAGPWAAPERGSSLAEATAAGALESPHLPEGQVDPGAQDPLAAGQAVVPVAVGGVVHHQEAAVLQLQPDRMEAAAGGGLASGGAVPEDKVPAGSKGGGGYGAAGDQLPLVVSVLPHAVLPVFVPAEPQGKVRQPPPSLLDGNLENRQKPGQAEASLSPLTKGPAALPDSHRGWPLHTGLIYRVAVQPILPRPSKSRSHDTK